MVKLVRLISGEELLCKVIESEDDSCVKLKNVAILIPAGKEQLALAQWMPYADYSDGVELKKESILFTVDAQDELKNQYNTSFGSGLVVPSSGGIQGAGAPGLKLTT
jgi:hypothetical protein